MTKKKLLSHVEEIELCKSAQNGCKKSFDTMVVRNLGLVGKLAKKMYYKNEQYTYDDLFQEGVFGLMRAIEKFDAKEGCRFSTYSYYWIYSFVSRYNVNHQGRVRIPAHVKEKLAKLEKTDPEAYIALKSTLPSVGSLNSSIGDISTLEDLVSDGVPQNLDCEMEIILDQMKVVLKEREYNVLCDRYGLDGKFAKSQRECGKIYGVSYAMIHIIEKKAIQKLREHFS